MFKLCFCVLLFAASGFCIFLTAKDDKKNILLLFSTSIDSPDTLLNETNTYLIDPAKITVFLVHGWTEDRNAFYYPLMFTEFIKKGGYNVIRVDWGKYSQIEYFTSAYLIRRVGNFLGNYINTLQQNGVQLTKIHIIGHSLGAHVAGFAGKHIKSLNGLIGRISGLDPAGPKFGIFASSDDRLDAGDANMVDCLYTNRGLFGTSLEIGTHNFYANNAFYQPGCPIDDLFCSHQMSTVIYSESINSNRFRAVKISIEWFNVTVDSSVIVIFGENTNATAGSYHFNTTSSAPYVID